MSSDFEKKEEVAAPPAGAPFKLWVHLFETGSTTRIGEGSVLISDANDVDDLRKALIREFPETAGQEANKLVVRPTRGGEPLTALRTKLSAVEFKREDDGSLHAFVDVAPKPEGAAAVWKVGWEIIDTSDALPLDIPSISSTPSQRYPNKNFTSNIDFLPWDEFFADVKDWDPKPFLNVPVEVPLWTRTRVQRKMKDEDDVSRAVARVLDVVSWMTGTDVFGQQTTSTSAKRKHGGDSDTRRTRPDHTFSKDGADIAVIEIKKPLFKKGGDELIRLAKAYVPDAEEILPESMLCTSAFATLQQLNTYFENSSLNIGVISDYEYFWFVKKVDVGGDVGGDEGGDGGGDEGDDEGDERQDIHERHDILLVSNALPRRCQAPTVLRALCHIVSLAIQESQAKPQTPSGATAVVAEEKHLETDSKQTPSSNDSKKKKGSEAGGKKGKGPSAPMHSLGFGRCGRVLIAPSPAGPVAVKFVRKRSSLLEELQHEAQMYQALVPLQGSVLPKLYHAGPVFDGKYFGLCLEPVGITVSRALALGVNRDFLKKAALDALDKLHAAKFTHGDIRDRNICYEPQTKRVRLIDLGFAAPLKDELEAKEERGKMRSLFDGGAY